MFKLTHKISNHEQGHSLKIMKVCVPPCPGIGLEPSQTHLFPYRNVEPLGSEGLLNDMFHISSAVLMS